MNGWKYEWVDQLPHHVYTVLVDKMKKAYPDDNPDDE